MRSHLFAALLAISTASAQTTFIVDIDNRPGATFTDLPAAEAAASTGDTLRVRPSAFLMAYSAFTTSKGLTVVSTGARIGGRVQVTNIAANATFRFAGFEAPRGQELQFTASGCQGIVQLEDLHATEYGWFFPTTPSIVLQNCAHVAMHDVEDFGTPAVQVDNSTVLLTRCRLGITSIHIGGGPCLVGTNSSLDVSEPFFDASQGSPIAAVALTNCALRLAGTAASYVQGSGSATASPAVQLTGGAAWIDPAVRLNPFLAGTTIGGTGSVVFVSTPGVSITGDSPGSTLQVVHSAANGDGLVCLLGFPCASLATPLGPMFVDPASAMVTAVSVVGNTGTFVQSLPVPAGLPVGLGFSLQDVVVHAAGIALGNACQFVVH